MICCMYLYYTYSSSAHFAVMCQGRIVAIGECGLDKHYLTDEASFQEQQRVLRQLLKVCATNAMLHKLQYVMLCCAI